MEPSSKMDPIRFGFCNANGVRNRVNGMINFINDWDIDVMMIVETWLRPGQHLPLSGLNVVTDLRIDRTDLGENAPRGREGILIVARPEIATIIKVITIGDSKRWIVLKIDDIYIVCCYFSPLVSNTEIEMMIDSVLGIDSPVHTDRLLFVGDFNARMSEYTGDHTNNTRGSWFAKNILKNYAINVITPSKGKWTTFSANGKGITDIIMTPNAFMDCNIKEYIIHEGIDMHGSDHRPLSWSVTMSKKFDKPIIERWNINRLQHTQYAGKMSHILHNTFNDVITNMFHLIHMLSDLDACHDRDHVQHIVDSMSNLFCNWITHAAEHSIGRAHYDLREQCKNFNTDTIEQTRLALSISCQKLANSESGSLEYNCTYAELHTASGYYKEICRNRRIELFQQFVEEMSLPGNRRIFQKRVSAMKCRENRGGCQLDPDKLDVYTLHFDQTFGGDPKGMSVTHNKSSIDENECMIDFDVDIVKEALGKLAKGKAAGPDKIHTELLQHEMDLTSQLLSLLFKICYKFAIVPHSWCRANVALVYKKKGSVSDVSNYRPISLTSIIRRLYEKILMGTFMVHTEATLKSTQGGFRPRQSTLHQCFTLHEIMSRHGGNLVYAFLDLKAAYDCVNRTILWRDLQKYGFPNHLISVCKSLFDNNVSNLVANGGRSSDIMCKRGLLQGSSLSPMLFNLYINELIVRLDFCAKTKTRNLITNNLFYADDGCLFANRDNMQSLLDICTHWAADYGMQFAANKCVILSRKNECFTIQGDVIPTHGRFVYLGVECSVKGMCWEAKQRERCLTAMSTARFMKSKGMNALGWRTNLSVAVYKSFIRPSMEYGLPLLINNKAMMDYLEKTQNCILNMILSSDRSSSRGGKLKLLQVETMEARRKKLQFQFFQSLDEQGQTGSPASTIWHSRGRGKPSKMQSAARGNCIMQFAVAHTEPAEIRTYCRELKFASMQIYDKFKDGKADVAASITTPTTSRPSVYLDPTVDRDTQRVITYLRLGSFAFHQPCAKCGLEVSRKHAATCSMAEITLRREFPDLYSEFGESVTADSLLFQDFLLNKLDNIYGTNANRHLVERLVAEIGKYASTIRAEVSGYEQTSDGRSWFHPMKVGKRKVMYKRYQEASLVAARRACIRASRNRPVGRPARRKQDLQPP